MFKEKLDFVVNSWITLETLNARMLPVMQKFEMLQQDSPVVVAATAAFVSNYRAIGAVLTAMEARAAADVSILPAAQARCAEVIARIAAMAAELGATVRTPFQVAVVGHLRVMADLGVTTPHVSFLKERLRAAGVAAPAFELLYRASVDGITAADVQRKCKGKGPVLVIGREATRGWLFGGYIDCGLQVVRIDGEGKPYDSDYQRAPQSFAFTLTNPHDQLPTAWRRGRFESGVLLFTSARPSASLCWLGMLQATAASVLEWQATDDGSRDDGLSLLERLGRSVAGRLLGGRRAEDRCYEERGPHDDKVFTGSKSWRASDVVIYSVLM